MLGHQVVLPSVEGVQRPGGGNHIRDRAVVVERILRRGRSFMPQALDLRTPAIFGLRPNEASITVLALIAVRTSASTDVRWLHITA